MTNKPVYVVIGRDLIIAEDLGEMVRGYAPGADIRIANDRDGTLALLSRPDTLTAAIIDLSGPGDVEDSVRDMILQRGGRLIVLRNEASEGATPEGTTYLSKPFTEQMITAALAGPAPPA